MTVLVIAEHDNVSLHAATRHAVGAARLCGGDVHLLVAGHDCAAAAREASRVAGVAKVWHADAAHLAHGLAENVAAQALQLLGQEPYTHVLAAASTCGKSIMPRIAAGLDAGQISEVTRGLDAIGDLPPGNGLQLVELSLQRLQARGGDDDGIAQATESSSASL